MKEPSKAKVKLMMARIVMIYLWRVEEQYKGKKVPENLVRNPFLNKKIISFCQFLVEISLDHGHSDSR